MPANVPDLDVEALIADVVAGRKRPDTALRAIEACASWLASQPPDSLTTDFWGDWFARVYRDTRHAVLELLVDDQPTRVLDVGRIVVAASRLIPPPVEAVTRLFVAQRLMDLDRADWALDHLAIEDGVADAAPLVGLKLRLLRAEALLNLKRAADAEPIVAHILSTASTAPREIVAQTMQLRSQVRSKTGQSLEALEDAREAVDRWKSLNDTERQNTWPGWKFYYQLGDAARTCGHFAEALAAFESGRSVAIELGHSGSATFLLSEIGFTWRRAGDEERGTEFLREAAKEAEALGQKTWAARWVEKGWLKYPRDDENLADKLSRATALLRQGPPKADEAAALFKECLRIAVEEKNPEVEHAARNGVASAYRLKGRLLQAELAEREAIAAAEAVGDVSAGLGYRINLGWILAKRGRRDEAEAEAEQAARIGENLVHAMSSVELRQTVAARLSGVYELMALCSAVAFVPPNSSEALPPRPDRVFAVGQRTRAVNLTRWLALGEVTERLADDELTRLLTELRAADVRFEAAAEERKEPLGPLAASQEEARARWTTAVGRRGTPPAETPAPCEPDELAAAFPDRCFIDLLSLSDILTINGFHSGGRARISIVDSKRESRTELLTEWQLTLGRVARSEGYGRQADASAVNRLNVLNRELDEQIIVPVARSIEQAGGSSHVVIFPHRELFQVPFWRLDSILPGVTISVLPGPGAALILGRRTRRTAVPWTAFGDVTGRLAQVGRELAVASFDEPCVPTATTVLERSRAAALVHFAGHGYFNPDNPYRSGLLAGAEPGDIEDPFFAADPHGRGHRVLTIAWILGRLRLPACHTVVLSACYTGLPREHPASEFTSLPAALLVAGSRNVIASLWPAHDAAALVLMQQLYREMPRTSATWRPSGALARARRQLMEMGRDEALERLEPGTVLPIGDRPFAAAWASDLFQHYGVD